MDRLTPSQRRRCMQHNKSKNTSIEIMLGRALWQRGLRYRKHAKGVLGHPDFCFKGRKVAVFCDGDFWHGRDWENARQRLKGNREFWIAKIERNQQRDKEITEALERSGWTVVRFWEHDIRKHLTECVDRVEAALNGARVALQYEIDQRDSAFVAAEDELDYNVTIKFENMEKTHYKVVAAAVEHDGRYLCVQKGVTKRAYTSHKWEFPGGKIENGETEPQALLRELHEEMDYAVVVDKQLCTVNYEYPDFFITLSVYICHPDGPADAFVLHEHADARWMLPSELNTLDWADADADVIGMLVNA